MNKTMFLCLGLMIIFAQIAGNAQKLILIGPNSGTILTTVDSVKLAWHRDANFYGQYALQVSNNSNFTPLLSNLSGHFYDTTVTLYNLSNNIYYWEVFAGASYSSTWSFTINVPPHGLISPADGATMIDPSYPEFYWYSILQPGFQATSYTLCISTSPDSLSYNTCTKYTFYYTGGTLQSNGQPVSLGLNTTYYWMVFDSNHPTIKTDIWHFTTSGTYNLVRAVTLISPPDNAVLYFGVSDVDSVNFVWNKGDVSTRSYDFTVATDSSFSKPFRTSTKNILTDTTQLIKNFAHTQRYWWRVFVTNQVGAHASSLKQSFIIDYPSSILHSVSARTIKSYSSNVKYYNLQGRAVKASALPRIYIQEISGKFVTKLSAIK